MIPARQPLCLTNKWERLLGITFVQSFIYFTSNPGRDRSIFRAYVALLVYVPSSRKIIYVDTNSTQKRT